jgi:type VI protein secretion system component Hcp
VLGVGVAGGAAAVAVATVPDSSAVIHACVAISDPGQPPIVSQPNVTVIDPSAGQSCDPVHDSISWNVQGPPGQTGAQGPAGKSVTVVSGHTLTLAGGQVITVGGGTGKTFTIGGITPRPSGRRLTLTIDGMTVPILSFGFLATQKGTGSGQVQHSDLTVTKYTDKASAQLALACAKGTHFKKATVTVRKAGKGQQEFLVYKLSNVQISADQTAGGGGNARPQESISFNFTKIQTERQPQ